MKRSVLAIIFACFTLVVMAQDVIKVKYEGARPTIQDFAQALLFSGNVDDNDCDEASNAAANAMTRYLKGEPQEEGQSFTIDQKNGFMLYESKYKDPEFGEYLTRYEMCYWNESDQKHKLIGYSVACYHDGKYEPGQFDGLVFYRYDNAKKQLEYFTEPGFENVCYTEDGANVTYSLPRSGKDITATYWYETGKKQKTLKWDGHQFSF